MGFDIIRGTNISHWLSQSDARGETRKSRFTRDDCRRLADLGLDHLRLPVDEEQLWTEDGTRENEAWDLLNEGLDWCADAGMRAVVDLHILRSHHFVGDSDRRLLFHDDAVVARFADCWRDLSRGLCTRSTDRVAYELMNEPVADDPADWNRVLRAPYHAIRENEPDRVIAVGSNKWNQTATYPDFDPPTGDPNMILVFHYYNPMLVTHHQASWSHVGVYDGPIVYPGAPIPESAWDTLDPDMRDTFAHENQHFDVGVMEENLQPVLEKSREMNLPLWCNEFGVITRAPDDIRHRWTRDLVSRLETHGIAWANWDYRGDFGLFDRQDRPSVVLDALLG